jgi:predicted small lipoprotein YifL
MKTKLIYGVLAMLILLSLAGCGGRGENTPSNNNPTNAPSSSGSTSDGSTTPPQNNGLSESSLLAMPEDSESLYTYVEYEGEVIIGAAPGNYNEIMVIPSKIDGKSVTGINIGFSGSSVKAVVIPEGVKFIGDAAFQGCAQLEIVCFKGNSVTKTEKSAFHMCTKLSTVNLPDSVTEIGEMAFAGCSNLKQLKFPTNLKTISGAAFYQTGFETINFSEGLEIIGNAFSMCENLKNVTIPASVKEIDADIFGAGAIKNKVKIITPAGSYAEQFAKDNGFEFENK